MKISNLSISNFLGIGAAEVQLTTPVTLFAGRNGAGKSSLCDAVALALTADLGRVSLKKDACQLVRAGTSGAQCMVETTDGEHYNYAISPTGKIISNRKGYEIDSPLDYALDAQRFAQLDSNERRAFLFSLMNLKTDGPAIVERLTKRGCVKDKIDRIAPLLRSGFDAACKQAKAHATEAKGAWRAVTGETYGSEKAKTWRAPAPKHDVTAEAGLKTELQACDAALEQCQQSIGKLQSQEQRRKDLRAKLPALIEQAERTERIQAKLAVDGQQLGEWEADLKKTAEAAGAVPRTGLVHELAWAVANLIEFSEFPLEPTKDADHARVLAALAAYEAEHGKVNSAANAGGDAKARDRLPNVQKSRDLMNSAVANGKRDLEAATRAQAEADAIEAELSQTFDAAALDKARQQAETLKQERATLTGKLDAIKTLKDQASQAAKKTADAAAHAADVSAWDAIGDALAPDGIPGEMLAEALGPINQRLAQSHADTLWPRAEIAADMSITAGGRDYRLLSESERWRTDAMLAEAIANISGVRLLVLDRFDVLDLTNRSRLLGWLDALADTSEIDTALVFGTLKALPATLPPTIAAHWIENGVVGQLKEAA